MNLQQLIIELNRSIHISDIKHFLKKYNDKDYLKYAHFDKKGYARNVIYSSDNFDIVLICWNELQPSSIHDHPEYCCYFKLLEGCLFEDNYIYHQNNLIFTNTNLVNKDELSYRNSNQILHKIIPIQKSISLHIYIPGKYKTNYYLTN
jgi:cysteine dioxygenase